MPDSSPQQPAPTSAPIQSPSVRRPLPANIPPGRRPVNGIAVEWIVGIAVALALAAVPPLLDGGLDPEALQATSDSVEDANNGVLLALKLEQAEARGAQR